MSRQAAVASTLRIALAPATERASIKTLSALVGTEAPVAPPDEADQVLVADHRLVVAAGKIAYLLAIIHLLFAIDISHYL